MRKYLTPLALALAVGFGAAAHADAAKPAGDLYREAAWNISAKAESHATAAQTAAMQSDRMAENRAAGDASPAARSVWSDPE